ncbi:MAG: hypothetical protein ACTSPY_16195 [Candidatus Helarchaeota archaeon]
MGRTVPTFRMALESEILLWKDGYRKSLRKDDKIAFDMIMNNARLHGDAGSMSGRPIIFEVMVMNVLLEIQKKLLELGTKVEILEKKVKLE